LRTAEKIRERLESVEEIVKEKLTWNKIITELKEVGDLERLISRICTGRANPREVVALKTSLKRIPSIIEFLSSSRTKLISEIRDNLSPLEKLVDKIQASIIDSPPAAINEGGIIRAGFSPELDELRDISVNGKDWIAKLQKTER
jgi:DNA mismatch repair protein MutS